MTGEHRVTFGTIRNSQTMRVALVALTLAATGLAAVVGAANRFAVVGVENGTHVTIRMHHRWGDGSWTTDVLQPGGRKWFWQTYDYANENRSDRFHVRFDSDLHPGQMFTIDYDLKKNAAPAHEWENAHKYIFRYDGSRNFIDLYQQ
ncbi:MAG TPA: hypothetical protein VKE96_29280 [Vicinamibacterales bacterium]|nr:hypothetical protein [Vicinamibacterales bacterium]